MRFEELEFNIMKWANNKDLLTKDNEYQQYAKFLEEGTEILVAINKLNKIRATIVKKSNKNSCGKTVVFFIKKIK